MGTEHSFRFWTKERMIEVGTMREGKWHFQRYCASNDDVPIVDREKEARQWE